MWNLVEWFFLNVFDLSRKKKLLTFSYAGVIMMVPVIQYSSMFILTSNVIQFYSNPEIHADSINFVQLDKGIEFV